MMRTFTLTLAVLALSACAFGAPLVTMSQGYSEAELAEAISATDLINGQIATELPGDTGWHSANTDPADKLPALTDGIGMRATGLTGLLNDFPGAGNPTKKIQYDLAVPADIWKINIFSGNNGGDGRIFHTYTVQFSNDFGLSFGAPIYVQSHWSGTLNNAANNMYTRVLGQLTDDGGGPLAFGVTNIAFDFYAVDNTDGQMRDPYDGVNPFTGLDDGLTAAFVSPLILEIDVVPEPASLFALGSGLVGFGALIRRRKP